MKNTLLATALLLTLPALADPAVNKVMVNFHNNTAHPIEFISFDSGRILANTSFAKESIDPFASVDRAIFVTSFDKEPVTAGVNALINGEPMKFMWQVNMGPTDSEEVKFHICGVIKDNNAEQLNHEYCYIPYVVGSTLIVDFNIE
jgi:hypothetical protein